MRGGCALGREPLTRENESVENKAPACARLRSLAHWAEGRASIVAVDALAAAAALLKDDVAPMRVAAGEFPASMAKHAMPAAAKLRYWPREIARTLLASAAVDDAPPATAAAKAPAARRAGAADADGQRNDTCRGEDGELDEDRAGVRVGAVRAGART